MDPEEKRRKRVERYARRVSIKVEIIIEECATRGQVQDEDKRNHTK